MRLRSWGNPESAWGTGLGKQFELEKSMSESGSIRSRVGRAKEKADDHPSSSRRLAEPEGVSLKGPGADFLGHIQSGTRQHTFMVNLPCAEH